MHSPKFIARFFELQAASGIILVIATAAALFCANSGFAELYFSFLQQDVFRLSVQHCVNDGLMSIFFLLVGLEIKREFVEGELSQVRQAMLPIAAALGGMIVPALIYSLLNHNTRFAPGWGIPIATDIAFAISILTLLGNRAAPSLKVLLTSLAIVDDLGAVLVIALFYPGQISWFSLIFGVGILGFLFVLNFSGVRKLWVYLILGVLTWLMFLRSGIHATIAGVLLAWVIPVKSGVKLEHYIHPFVSYLIMPIFAFANAGISFTSANLFHQMSLGIILGLVVGKSIGITGFSWLAVKMRIAELPSLTSWKDIFGLGLLAGIGFTMSFFIANLAFDDYEIVEMAKAAVLVASVLAAIAGCALLAINYKKT